MGNKNYLWENYRFNPTQKNHPIELTLIFAIKIAVTTSPPSLSTKNILPDHP
ncbi:hypothetical protein C789_1858 [Microcystis aeruginosa FACHB-905 = DIANCHI905]|nr:hypothetical protein C789_1858 [Microcystis aeruginosa FACHB-905 = DIANCHI905]